MPVQRLPLMSMWRCVRRPPGSKVTYYIDTTPADGAAESLQEPPLNTSGAGYSETTVESTHPGSDDAVGPQLPPHAYGSRRETVREKGAGGKSASAAPTAAAGAGGGVDGAAPPDSALALGTIQEQSMVSVPAGTGHKPSLM